MKCIHPTGHCQITVPCKDKCAVLVGGVAFIMGPGGDEGTRRCTCNEYPHRPFCGVAPDDIDGAR